MGRSRSRSPSTSSPMASDPPATISSGGRSAGRIARPASSDGPPQLVGPVGPVVQRQPPLGQLGGHLDVLGPERGDVDGDPLAHGVVHDLERLAETPCPRPSASGTW